MTTRHRRRRACALLVLGTTTGSLSAAEPFTEEAEARGINFTVSSRAPYGAGAAFADLDGDGDPDLVLVGRHGGGIASTIAIYENNGHGVFTDRTFGSGAPVPSYPSSVTAADYDGDGDLDVHIGCWAEPDLLLRNEGGFSFRDMADRPEMGGLNDAGAAAGCAWADIDGDGWLDLYVANRTSSIALDPPHGAAMQPNRLYRNLGGRGFEEIAGPLGVAADEDPSFQAAFFDYDRDGDPDLYLANDKGMSDAPPCSYRNHLWENVGGAFVEVSAASGADGCIDSMCIALGDLDRNGYLDIYVSNIPVGNPLYMNNGDGTFTEASDAYGVASYEVGWGSTFFDYDNDGYLDLYVCQHRNFEPNHLYDYDGDGPAADVAPLLGVADNKESFASAAADIDGDGDLDLVVSDRRAPAKLFVNHEGSSRSWAKFRVQGEGANRFAVGARVDVVSGGIVQCREVIAGSGFKSQDDLTVHVGLGDATVVDLVTVTWPGGAPVRQLTGYPAQRAFRIVPPSALGDLDGDGVIGLADWAGLASAFGQPVQAGLEMMDFDGDADVDVTDAAEFLARYEGPLHDCDGNGQPDLLQLLLVPDADADGTAIPDTCEAMGDLDGDGTVGVTDSNALLAAWGPCPASGACPADLDDDGHVGAEDLLILLGSWSG
ncbi:MAG: FG-GAP-like repeat-containing protein [Planctomycetota bacterium]|jgi:hypothetical protein